MAYPNITPQNGVKESTIGKTVTSNFNTNYVQQRSKTTRKRKKFDLTYMLTASEYATLDTFFSDELGNSFAWTHPTTATIYTVRFAMDTLQATYIVENLLSVKVMLEEV